MKRFDAHALWSLPRVGSPRLSPGGEDLVFPVTTQEAGASRSISNLILMSAVGGATRQLTTAKTKDMAPVWSPDGRRIAFLRKSEEGPAQLMVVPIDGGEPEQLTELPVAVASPSWHPDGTRILFVAEVPAGAADWTDSQRILQERKDRKVSARVTEDRLYRFWSRWIHEGDFPHIFQLDVSSGEIADLTPNSQCFFDLMDAGGRYDISPDGGSLVYEGLSTPPPYTEPLRSGLFRVGLTQQGATGEPVEITSGQEGSFFGPVFAPRDGSFAFGWRRDPLFYADRIRIGVWPAGESPVILAPQWDRSASEWQFRPDGSEIVFVAEDGHATGVYSLPVDPEAAAPQLLAAAGTASSPRPAPDGAVLCVHHDASRPPEIARIDPGVAGLRRLTDLATSHLDGVELGAVSQPEFTGADGNAVGMMLVHPPGYDPSRKWPLVHLVHGGPHGQFGDCWHWRWNAQVFASLGYVVAMVNFHGSTGRGDAFTRSILGEHPIKPMADVMAATDLLIEEGGIDEQRMAVTGGSYGGFLVTWIVGHTDRFAACVNHAGVVDLLAQMGSDVTHGRLLAYGGEPWNDLEAIERHSPSRFSRDMVTPMLVIHGEQDFRVPIGNALEIYGILKAKGVPARLVYYPDENHWILKAENSLHWYGEIESWLERWLGK